MPLVQPSCANLGAKADEGHAVSKLKDFIMAETWRIEDLIPHRGEMLLIDTVVKVGQAVAVTEAMVSPRWPLMDQNGASPIVLVELAAQTAGVCLGWNRLQRHPHEKGKPGGWIVGIKKADFHGGPIPLSTRITTHITTELAVENYMEIAATAAIGDSEIAHMRLQVLEAEKTAFADIRK